MNSIVHKVKLILPVLTFFILLSALVTVVHIKGTAKNAADEKLRQSIRRFADEHKPPATIIIITGDVNFAPDISDFKNRRKYSVLLIHPEQVKN